MTGSCLNKTARPNQRPGIPDPGSGHGGSGDVGSTASNLIYLRNRLSNSGFLAVCADRSPCFGASGYDLLEALHTTYRTAVDIPLRDPVNIPIFRKSTPGYICLGLCEVTARSFKRCLGRTEIRAREGSVARIKTVDSSNGAVVGGGAGFRDWIEELFEWPPTFFLVGLGRLHRCEQTLPTSRGACRGSQSGGPPPGRRGWAGSPVAR